MLITKSQVNLQVREMVGQATRVGRVAGWLAGYAKKAMARLDERLGWLWQKGGKGGYGNPGEIEEKREGGKGSERKKKEKEGRSF